MLENLNALERVMIGSLEKPVNSYDARLIAHGACMILNIDWTLFFEDIKPTIITINDDPVSR